MEDDIISNTSIIKKETLGDQITNLLKKRIIDEEWDVGEKIPSENALAAEYGVSRLTIRIAIQKLISLGILETKVGDGNYIIEFNYHWYMDQVSDILVCPEMLRDVRDFRKVIEIESAKLAMKNATEEQLQAMETLAIKLDSFVVYLDKGLDYNVKQFSKLDWSFHYKLVEASNNSLFILAYSIAKEPITKFLYEIVRSRWEKFLSKHTDHTDNILKTPTGHHMSLVKAIRENDFNTFDKYALLMFDYDNKDYYFDN